MFAVRTSYASCAGTFTQKTRGNGPLIRTDSVPARLVPAFPPAGRHTASHRVVNRSSFVPCICRSGGQEEQNTVVILENDGVLVDVHNHGHRRAFNEAFDEMGYSCSQWSPHIYYDLLRFGDSTGEGLVRAYFDMVGWPIMLSTSDRPAFVEKIYSIKKRVFRGIVERRDFPLRDGAAVFVEQALEAGARLVVLSGTASDPNEHVVDAVMDILGERCRENIQVLNVGDMSGDDAAGSDGDGEDATFEQLVAQVQGKGKAKSATSFVRAMNLQSRGVGMRLDASMLAAGQSTVSPSYFSAVCATNGGCAWSSVLVAVSNSLMSSAKGAGLFTCAVPPSLQARGGYTAADGMYDGFGAGGGLTWSRVQRQLEARGE